jgi:hypothetical protein
VTTAMNLLVPQKGETLDQLSDYELFKKILYAPWFCLEFYNTYRMNRGITEEHETIECVAVYSDAVKPVFLYSIRHL